MVLELLHHRGFNGEKHGSVVAHPTEDGKFIYIAGSLLCLGDENEPGSSKLMKGHDGPITALAVSKNGKMIATACKGANADVIIWDATTLKLKYRFQEHDKEVTGLCFSPDDRVLASTGVDRRLFFIDTSTGELRTSQAVHACNAREFAPAWVQPSCLLLPGSPPHPPAPVVGRTPLPPGPA